MKFAFCGNLDCPEWVLSEIAILNRMSAIKLKLILGQMGKKLTADMDAGFRRQEQQFILVEGCAGKRWFSVFL